MHNSILDTDLYKISMQQAVCQLYPRAKVKYKFFDRNNTVYPDGFADKLVNIIEKFSKYTTLVKEEKEWLLKTCSYLSPVYIDFLSGYKYDHNEVEVHQKEDGTLSIEISGYWYRTILWEVPLMAMISELYFGMTSSDNQSAVVGYDLKLKLEKKAKLFKKQGSTLKFAEFGTRRR